LLELEFEDMLCEDRLCEDMLSGLWDDIDWLLGL
jgi:hypothetical protein